jgi:hypothetical protein
MLTKVLALPIVATFIGGSRSSPRSEADDIVMVDGWVIRRSDLERLRNDP